MAWAQFQGILPALARKDENNENTSVRISDSPNNIRTGCQPNKILEDLTPDKLSLIEMFT
jgi:hypothetical protein